MKAKILIEMESNMFEVQRISSQLDSALEKVGVQYKITVMEQVHSVSGPVPQTFYTQMAQREVESRMDDSET